MTVVIKEKMMNCTAHHLLPAQILADYIQIEILSPIITTLIFLTN